MPERARARAGVPALLVTGAAAAAWSAYQLAPPALAELAIAPYAACLVLGPALVYPLARRRGASGRAAVAWSLLLPLLWLAKELHRVSAVYGVGETLYYALNPLSLGVFGAAATQMALAELLRERQRAGRWRLRGAAGATLATIALLAVAAAWVGHDSGGRDIFYGYIALYRLLFPAG